MIAPAKHFAKLGAALMEKLVGPSVPDQLSLFDAGFISGSDGDNRPPTALASLLPPITSLRVDEVWYFIPLRSPIQINDTFSIADRQWRVYSSDRFGYYAQTVGTDPRLVGDVFAPGALISLCRSPSYGS